MYPLLIISLLSITVSACLFAGDVPMIGHAFLASDPKANCVAWIDATGTVVRKYPVPCASDATVLPGGTILVANKNGAQEIDRGGTVVWKYQAPAKAEVWSCQKLPDGRVLVCECGTRRLVEVDATGAVVAEIPVPTQRKTHDQFRIARKLASGHYLVACWRDGRVLELDGVGKIIRSIDGLGEAYMAQRLSDGNTLIGCGDTHRVVEIDPQGKTVWSIAGDELPGHPLRFVAHVERLANGNTIICNWPCHGFEGKQPLIVEVTRDKRVVWQYDGRDRFRGISNINLLDGVTITP